MEKDQFIYVFTANYFSAKLVDMIRGSQMALENLATHPERLIKSEEVKNVEKIAEVVWAQIL